MSNEPDDATADCGRADPNQVSELLDAMPPHYGAIEREAQLEKQRDK